jgi:hypothetical protein
MNQHRSSLLRKPSWLQANWPLLVCGALSWFAVGPLLGQPPPSPPKEYKVKATFLFNFAQFVEWPAAVFADATAPIIIGVLGDDEFGPFLDQIVQGETIRNRPLIIKRSRTVDELKRCHILFISKSEESQLATILASLNEAPVLTVGEVEGFIRSGGVINFCLRDKRVRFEVNPVAGQNQKLRLSAQLLQLSVKGCS